MGFALVATLIRMNNISKESKPLQMAGCKRIEFHYALWCEH